MYLVNVLELLGSVLYNALVCVFKLANLNIILRFRNYKV